MSAVRGGRRVVAIDARGYFTRGGVGRYTRNLVDHLLRQCPGDLAFRLLISNRHQPDEIAVPAEAAVDVCRSRATWQEPDEEARYLEDEVAGADLFHSLTGQWVPASVRTVSSIHDLTPLVCPTLVSDHIRLLFQSICRGLSRAVRVLAGSQNTAQDLTRLLDVTPARITTVYYAADRSFSPRLPDRLALERFGVSTDAYFLAVGATAPHKNLVRLLRAYARTGVTAPLLVVGGGGFGGGVARAAADRLGLGARVRIVPGPDDEALAQLYSGCRGFLYPSLYEGFGLPVLEAMACGAPVVCSSTSSLPEVAGDDALLVNPERDDELAGAICRLDDDPELRLALRGRGPRRAARFSWERAARETLEVYRRLLEDAA